MSSYPRPREKRAANQRRRTLPSRHPNIYPCVTVSRADTCQPVQAAPTRQPWQDAISQRWVMLTGRRVREPDLAWLDGPIGDLGEISDGFIERLAQREGLELQRHSRGAGLLTSFDAMGLDSESRARLAPGIDEFYERTTDHSLEVWSEWNPLFCIGGGAIRRLYSRRLQQLNLPQRPLDTARGITSEIIILSDPATGERRYTFWFRTFRHSGEVIYCGSYSTVRLPDGRTRVKVCFPLPNGSATVLMSIAVGASGELTLTSSGRGYGDPGLYLVLRDKRGQLWTRYLRSFREQITVYREDDPNEPDAIRADHTLSVWGVQAVKLHYKIRPRPAGAAAMQTAGRSS